MTSSTAPSQRQLRAGELIRHALAEIFMRAETGDPELEQLGVTVLEVTMSPDLRLATVYVRPFAAGKGEMLIRAIERNRRYIRGLVAPRVAMKFMPELRFRLDTASEHAERIDRLLHDPAVMRDLKSEQR